jgi:NitT/TauT family transport system ATP-binding protein
MRLNKSAERTSPGQPAAQPDPPPRPPGPPAERSRLVVSNLRKTLVSATGVAREVLADISFEVTPGEFVAIVGPSGAGKTTLLRTISGLLAPDSGEVRCGDVPVRDVPPWLSIVFQDYGKSLFPWMSNSDNVALALPGVPRRERDSRAAWALDLVGMGGVAGHYPWELSGGMQQRVAIARAICGDLSVLIMDEPFASVDALTRTYLEDEVLRLWNEIGFSAVLVTHDVGEAVYMADRVIVLSPRPATIAGEVSVDLPRPRGHLSTRRDARFGELYAEVMSLVEAGDPQRRASGPATPQQRRQAPVQAMRKQEHK